MPGLAKVGRTTRPPAERVAELSGATGVATPFVLAFDQPAEDCAAAERAVHAELDRRGWRVAPNREFFRGSPAEIVRVVLDATGGKDAPIPAGGRKQQSGAALLLEGDRCLAGDGAVLQDTDEALRLYRQAAARGEVQAYERLGRVLTERYLRKPDSAARRRALAPLQQGARRGNAYCYAEMATLFAAEGHVANHDKAWSLFFAGLHPGTLASARATAALCRYVASCLQLGREPAHLSLLGPALPAMQALLSAELAVLPHGSARQAAASALRWVFLRRPRGRHSFAAPGRQQLLSRAASPNAPAAATATA